MRRHSTVSLSIALRVMAVLLCLTGAFACKKVSTSTPASSSTVDIRRAMSAAQAFPLAQKDARAWRKDAQWYGVVPYTSIERAFALPLADAKPSWFFRFASPSDGAEYVVEVVDGKVVGSNETVLPGYIEPPIAELQALGDRWTVLDNTALLEKYLQQADNLLAQFPSMFVDYRLAQPQEQEHPLWTLFNAQNLTGPVFVLDAVTGESVPVQ
jgi:hypothetical protein